MVSITNYTVIPNQKRRRGRRRVEVRGEVGSGGEERGNKEMKKAGEEWVEEENKRER